MTCIYKKGRLLCLLMMASSMLMAQSNLMGKDSLLSSIRSLQERLKGVEVSTTTNDREANRFVQKCMLFAKSYPKDSLSKQFIFMAADVSRGLENYGKAIEYWQLYYDTYPDTRLHPVSIFLMGFTYHENIKDQGKAKLYFNKFLKEYPEHELARDAKVFLIVVEELLEKNSSKN